MVAPATIPNPAVTSARHPLFGGYALVAVAAAWVAGIALRALGPLPALTVLAWLLLAAACAGVWIAGASLSRWHASAPAQRIWRAVLVTGMLGCWIALGAARAASMDTSFAANSVARLANNRNVHLRGTVASEPDLREGHRLLTLDVTQVSTDGGHTWEAASSRVEATVNGPDDWFAPAYGDTLTLAGKLQRLGSGYVQPGIVARVSGARATVETRGGGNPLLAALFALRLRLAEAIQRALPEPEAALLIGILLGLKTPALRARLPLFTATGTIHLVVPAGLKVSTLAEIATYAVRPLGRWARTLAALVAVGAYAAIGGGGPAAIRAAIMGALLALAPALGRAYNVFTALALATLVMAALEPAVIYDAGFQLTVLATFGLPLLVPPVQRRIAAWLRFLPGSAAIAELLAVTIAAQIATLPVLALTFHEISLVAPLANLLAVPLLAPLLALGGLLAVCVTIGGALTLPALALGWIVWPLLWLVDRVIEVCAALPAAALAVGDVPGAVAWVYYAALAGAVGWLAPWLRRMRRTRNTPGIGRPLPVHVRMGSHTAGHVRLSRGLLVGVLLTALLASLGAAAPALALARDTAHLDFLNVGPGGEAMLLRLPSGTSALIDGGADDPALEALLAGKLPWWRRSLDLAVLTDPRTGDALGLEDAAAHFKVARAADAGMAHPSAQYVAWLDATQRAGAVYTRLWQDDILTLGADDGSGGRATLRVLSPPSGLFPTNEGGSTQSDDLILRLDMPGLRALFLSAADDYALDALAGSGEPLTADVVEVALPVGSALDLAGPLGTVLAQAHPRLVVICPAPVSAKTAAKAAAGPDLWQLDVDAATQLGATIYRTDRDGTIALSGDSSGWSIGG